MPIKKNTVSFTVTIIIIMSLLLILYFLFNDKKDMNKVNDAEIEIQSDIIDYVDNISFEGLYMHPGQMEIGGLMKQGFGFSLHYTLPQVSHESDNPELSLQIVYPDEYTTVIGTSASPITYIKNSSTRKQTQIYSFDAYPSDISEERIDELINTKYYFKINIYYNDTLIKDIDITQTPEA